MTKEIADENSDKQTQPQDVGDQQLEQIVSETNQAITDKQEPPISLPENKELSSMEDGLTHLVQKLESLLATEEVKKPLEVVVCGLNNAGKSYFFREFCARYHGKFRVAVVDAGLPEHAIPWEEKDTADVLLMHEDNVGVDRGVAYYLEDIRGLSHDYAIYMYNPNIGQRVDDRMRSEVDAIICNSDSFDKAAEYFRRYREENPE